MRVKIAKNKQTNKRRNNKKQNNFWNEMRNDIFLCHFFWPVQKDGHFLSKRYDNKERKLKTN